MTFPKLRSSDSHLGGVNSWQPYTESQYWPNFSHFTVSLWKVYPRLLWHQVQVCPSAPVKTGEILILSKSWGAPAWGIYSVGLISSPSTQVPAFCPTHPFLIRSRLGTLDCRPGLGSVWLRQSWERQTRIRVNPGPCSVTNLPRNFGQVAFPLWASVSPAASTVPSTWDSLPHEQGGPYALLAPSLLRRWGLAQWCRSR